jgi:hypothetical protein
VTPHVGEPGCLPAPDLIGMGQSRKLEIAYLFEDQARYLEAWFDGLALDGVVLIGHDWGGALALDWAARHPGRVRGIGRRYFSAAWHLITQRIRGGQPFGSSGGPGAPRAWGKGGRSWIEQVRGS